MSDADEAVINALVIALRALTNEERLEVFAAFCKYCGEAVFLPCNCMRDD